MVNQKSLKSSCRSSFNQIDIYGIPIALYIEGEKKVKSTIGAFVSICIVCLLLAYAANELQIVIYRLHPVITTSQDLAYRTNQLVNPKKTGMKFAIGIINQYNFQSRDSEEFGYWEAYYHKWESFKIKSVRLKLEKCNQKDWDEFWPEIGAITHMKQKYKKAFYCLEGGENEWEIGVPKNAPLESTITLDFIQHKHVDKTQEEIDQYYTNAEMGLIANSQMFKSGLFGNQSIEDYSKMFFYPIFTSQHNQVNNFEVQRQTLVDHDSYIGFSQPKPRNFFTVQQQGTKPSALFESNKVTIIAGARISVAFEHQQITRKTLSLLDYMSSVGGIFFAWYDKKQGIFDKIIFMSIFQTGNNSHATTLKRQNAHFARSSLRQ